MAHRADLSEAWVSGYKAGKNGESRANNPYLGKSSDLAQEWDAGWKEGSAG